MKRIILFFILILFFNCQSSNISKIKDNSKDNTIQNNIAIEVKPYIRKMGKHLGSDIQEYIKLQVKENKDTQGFIEREAILTLRPHAKATILVCHGFMCNQSDVGFLRFIFKDYNVMTFDFRAHGKNSQDQCCTFGKDEIFEVIAAANYIKKNNITKNKPLIVYGFSMGAVAAILAQSCQAELFDALILDCPYDSTDNIIKRGLEKIRISVWGYELPMPGSSVLKDYAYTPYVQSLIKYFFKTIAKLDSTQVNSYLHPLCPMDEIKKIKKPIFIIGCVNDEKVPAKAFVEMFNVVSSDIKYLWLTDGIRHFDSFFFNPELYSYEVNNFIQKFLDKKFVNKKETRIILDKKEWEDEYLVAKK